MSSDTSLVRDVSRQCGKFKIHLKPEVDRPDQEPRQERSTVSFLPGVGGWQMDENEDNFATTSCRLGCRKVMSIMWDIDSSMSFSPEAQMSLNMSNLSSSGGDTPKRCLDLSNLSNGGEMSVSPENIQKDLCLASPRTKEPQAGECKCPVGRIHQFLPQVPCSSSSLRGSGSRTQARECIDFNSLGDDKENFDFEMHEVAHPTSIESWCLDNSMNDDVEKDGFSELMQNEAKSNDSKIMSSSMAMLLNSDFLNQEANVSVVPVRRSKPGLFRSPSMPEQLNQRLLKRVDRSRDLDIAVKNKRQRNSLQGDDPKQCEGTSVRLTTTSCTANTTDFDEETDIDQMENGSKRYLLPTVNGRQEDLMYITPATMAAVLRGEYNDVVSRTYIIDCRYPYEYEGGHIEGSLNLHKADSVINYFLKEPIVPVFRDQRIILIFHCEFSYVRGPKMCRLLREEDRNVNKYPKLHYPELYILKGGYKAFFLQFMRYCNPPEYCPMDHEDYQEEMLKLRKKSKSWAGERRRRDLISRLGMAKCCRSSRTLRPLSSPAPDSATLSTPTSSG
ncbi:M-phase inducer phosphatase 1-B [Callorhinchus milii]|uniref:M-phase inducer phosphatase 1-B n=1 Tax=Callorhinchus milii TaxID=7868 RepID=UPI000457567F|nr:M-phase inducer phosphatase 1-B [Callorhinchus milii]|eukprot:gi/632948634/ref/XP_007889702.1/ PREDICTED: M-phase inducer phosphatase 3 [Callorhinchus milii]